VSLGIGEAMTASSLRTTTTTTTIALYTLRQWQAALGALPAASTAVATPISPSSPSAASCVCTTSTDNLWTVLCNRYGRSDTDLLADRIAAYKAAVSKAMAPDSGFQLDQVVAVVASPGRDRLFMGHTDMIGLGGFTVDAATTEELIAIAQRTSDGMISLSNAQPDLYPTHSFPISECEIVGGDLPKYYSSKVWDPASWSSYVKGALAIMTSTKFGPHLEMKKALHPSDDVNAGMRILVSSIGGFKLPASGGVSSSAALTGAFSMCLGAVLGIGLERSDLSQVDFGEYFLGKSAGAADKMAQLSAKRGEIVVVGSFPERLISRMSFPTRAVTVLLAECPTPRLTTADGIKWLQSRYGEGEHFKQAKAWATSIMSRFCSVTYDVAARMMAARLRLIAHPMEAASPSLEAGDAEDARCAVASSKLSKEDAALLLASLNDDPH